MRYPAVRVDTKKLTHNTKVLVEKCSKLGIDVVPVTKVYCGMPEVAGASVAAGVKMLADSRIENIIKLKAIDVPKVLLRIPMLSQVDEIVEYVDISLNSEYEVIKALSEKALEKGKIHKIILMVDLGDLREGEWSETAVEFVGKIINLKGVKLAGVGTNLTCYGAVIPSKENLGLLVSVAEEIERKYDIKLDIISGGNSSSLHLLEKKEVPGRINQLRLGEAIVLGNETAYGGRISGTYADVFTYVAEIIELKEKPSVPVGETGVDAFGEKPVYTDRGIRKRAILATGRQDVRPDGISPRDKDAIVLGASSDHLIIDVSDCKKDYKTGDIMEFDMSYGAMLAAFTSEYVDKVIE
ncbi:MAG TPA: ornithine racemase Orr [Clostridia bacterium]|nr:ornithine racemase Orr [Clostridia bacterium]